MQHSKFNRQVLPFVGHLPFFGIVGNKTQDFRSIEKSLKFNVFCIDVLNKPAAEKGEQIKYIIFIFAAHLLHNPHKLKNKIFMPFFVRQIVWKVDKLHKFFFSVKMANNRLPNGCDDTGNMLDCFVTILAVCKQSHAVQQKKDGFPQNAVVFVKDGDGDTVVCGQK
ncbi:MAG: hypothetical protein HQL88_11005 [Magnetococcales bacterium]|nr:hypothetical protein [Magnetococcales bacterium]